MKKLCLALVALLLALCCMGMAAAEESNSVDVIMILDYSGSMTSNDPDNLMMKSAMNFIDMCDVSGTRIALIPFNSSSFPENRDWQRAFGFFRSLDSVTARETLRQDLLSAGFHYGSHTDGGPAFEKAWNLYNDRRNDARANGNAIVLFFSDGVIQIGTRSNSNESIASLNAANEVISRFENAGVPIYVIGLKGDGEFNPDWLNDIARRTGTSHARIVYDGDSSALHETFSEIFAAYLGTEPLPIDQRDIAVGDDGTAVISINIPNNSIVEANIRLSLDNPSASFGDVIGLTRPDGRSVNPLMNGTPREGDVIVGNSGAYYNMKLIRPEQGEWKLTLQVDQATLVSAEIIANYDIGIRFRDADVSGLNKGDSLRLEAEFYSTTTGEAYATDAFLYQPEMIASSVATWDGVAIENFWQVEQAASGTYLFVGTVDRLERGTYTFQIKVDGAGIQTETEVITLELQNNPPIRIGEDPAVLEKSVDSMLWRTADDYVEIALNDYFRDPDGDPLTYELSGRNESVNAVISGSKLKLTCQQAGDVTLTIKANDGQEYANRNLPITLSIKSCRAQATRELIMLCGALLLILIILIIIARKNRGRFIASAAFEATYSNLTFSMTPHSMIYLSRYDDKTVNLYTVLDDACAGMDACHQIDSAERTILGGFVLKPKRKGEVILTNKSSGGMYLSVSGAQIGRGKSVKLNTGSNVQIEFMEPGRCINLLYRHE